MLEEKKSEWKMIYRKMIEEQDSRYVLSLLRREKVEGNYEDYNVKLSLFEITSGRQDVFVFTEREILSKEQLDLLG